MSHFARLSVFFVLSALLFSLSAPAQDATAEKTEEPSSLPMEKRIVLENADAKQPVNQGLTLRPYRKMLPSGFRDVLKANQREQAYRVQEEYYVAIQRLRVRIEALEKERDLELEAILTPDQLEQVKLFRQTPASLREPARTSRRRAPRSTEVVEVVEVIEVIEVEKSEPEEKPAP